MTKPSHIPKQHPDGSLSRRRPLRRRLLAASLLAALLLFVSAVIGHRVQRGYDDAMAMRWPAPGQRVPAGGFRLHLHCTGHGTPTLVLEAGMSGWSQDWAWVQDRLSEGGRVCSYDRAGYGWSDAAPAPHLGLAAVDDLRRALVAAGEAPPWLLAGHSMGGLLAGMHARAYPRDVAGLAFIDAVGRDYAVQFPPQRYHRFRTGLGRLLGAANALAPLGLPRLMDQPASLITGRLPTDQRASATAWSFTSRHYQTLKDENAGFDATLQEALALPRLPAVPAVVLSSDMMRDFPAGLEDDVMRNAWQRNQETIAREAGVARVVLRGSGHYLHVEQPGQVVKALSELRIAARQRTAAR